MQVIEAYQPFELQEIELSTWKQRPVKNNFFELVVVRKGTGTQCIDYNEYPYQEGSIFLLPPLKCHSFQIVQPSQFVFLKFTSSFFHTNSSGKVSESAWFKEAAYILSNYNQLPGEIIHHQLDQQHIHTLIDLIAKEHRNHSSNSASLIKSLMVPILEILVRNIKQGTYYEIEKVAQHDERIVNLLSYINEHIAEPELLKVEQLARTFLLSPTYLSEFFRKNVKISLREYIIKSKLKRVEIRLLNSNYTLTQIANELSFTDVPHLSKTFKKYVGISIREFKKQGTYQILKRSTCE